MGDEKLINDLTSNFSTRLSRLKYLLLFFAFSIGIIAAINPRRAGAAESHTKKGIDIAIALDVSNSMLAADLPPNRLERAKQFISKLIQDRPNDRFALILFAGKAYLQMPLSADQGSALLFVSAASPQSVPQQGTVISDALKMSERAFVNDYQNYKSVILITDGEDHDEDAVQTAGELAEQGAMINTVGMGSATGTTIIDAATGTSKTDEAGNTIVSKLNEAILKDIAHKTHGIYIHFQDTNEAVQLLNNQLAQIDKKAFSDIASMSFINYFLVLAAISLLLMIVEIFIPEKKRTEVL